MEAWPSKSQPPSLENPFVGDNVSSAVQDVSRVSTSKPGESLCGRSLRLSIVNSSLLSQPPSLENPFVGVPKASAAVPAAVSQPPSLENPFVG